MPTKKVRYAQPLLGEANPAGYLIVVPGASVLIRQDGVECDVFADNDGTAMTNPVPTGVPVGTAGVDVRGTLLVYLDPGSGYDGVATVGGEASTFPIPDISPDVTDVGDPAAIVAVADDLDAFTTATATALAGKQDTIPSGTYAETQTPGVPMVAAAVEDLEAFPSDTGLSQLTDVELLPVDTATTPVMVEVLDGVLYGRIGSPLPARLFKSLDSGATWTLVGETPVNGRAIVKLNDGEVMLMGSAGLYRSTGWATGNPVWTLVLTPTPGSPGAEFKPWGFDTVGDICIASEYISGVADFSPSRYVRLSQDGGFTWTTIYDLNAVAAVPTSSHLHAVAIDRETGRFWISWHGGAEQDETHYSDDLGQTWTKLVGAQHPTVIVDHAEGTIMGLDGAPDGVNYVDPDLALRHLYRVRLGDPSLFGYAEIARYSADGILYVAFKSQIDGVPTIILASPDGLRADEVWRFANPGTQPEIPAIGVTSHGKLVARIRPGDGTEWFLRATPSRRATPVINTLNAGGIFGGTATQRAVAVGEGSVAGTPGTTERAVAVGQYSRAALDDSVAIGQKALASSVGSTAAGSRSAATATGATAIGDTSAASGSQSTALGREAAASGTGALAAGRASVASATNTTALGTGATATHIRSAAVGQGVQSERADCVHFGDRDLMTQGSTRGLIVYDPAGVRWRITVDTDGALVTTVVA